jgi:signal transduction histidine kinase/CHASE2 domain-containing sensor protein
MLAFFRRKPVTWRRAMEWRQRASWGIALGFLTALGSLLVLANHPIGAFFENNTLDFWYSLRDPQRLREVAIVTIDNATVRRWNHRTFDAADISLLLRLLHQHGARAVALNFFDLTDPNLRDPHLDDLERAMAATKFVHLPLNFKSVPATTTAATPSVDLHLQRFTLDGWDAFHRVRSVTLRGSQALQAPADDLLDQAAGAGHIIFFTDGAGGCARRMPLAIAYGGHVYPSLSLSTALQATSQTTSLASQNAAGDISPATRQVLQQLRGGTMMLNYPFGAADKQEGDNIEVAPTISLAQALTSPSVLDIVHGKVVVVGPTIFNQATQYPAPNGQRVSAAELHAIAIDNLLTNRPLRQASQVLVWLLTFLPCMIVGGFIAGRRTLLSSVAVLALLLISVAALSIDLFFGRIWLDISPSWLGSGVTFMAGMVARARRETHEATRTAATIEALTQVSEIIAAQSQQRQLLERVTLWSMNVMQATGASALLLDDDGETLRFAATTGPKWQELLPQTLKVGEGIAGWVVKHGEPVILNDVWRDPRFNPKIDQTTGFITRQILCVPIRVHQQILGAIEVVNRADSVPFTLDDAELLTAVANQAAVVLENSRLYDILSQRVVESESELAITNRRLEAERDLLQTVLQSMTDGVVVTDGDNRIRLINPAAAALMPELSDAAYERPLEEVLPGLKEQAPENARRAATLQLQRDEPDSTRFIEVRIAPLQSFEGKGGMIAVLADVTEERNIEQAKSDFVSFVAHEMRSPLTSISGFSSMLLQRDDFQANGVGNGIPGDSRTRFLSIIYDESERLTRLINNLLDVARIEAGRAIDLHPEVFSFAAVANEAVETQRGYSDRHQIVTDLPDELPPVLADRDKVKQVLINLLSNALKYAPGGTVTVGARYVDNMLQASVKDEGPGIPEDLSARLFQRFSRSSSASGTASRSRPTGTGLGLFLTKYLIEAHDGQIWVESEPGHGATFLFTLPLTKVAVRHTTTKPVTAPEVAPSGDTVVGGSAETTAVGESTPLPAGTDAH